MISLLARLFIKDYDDTGKPAVRQAYGVLCGGVGIVLNLLLFAGKLFAGAISGSVAVMADAFNNLSDAGSSAVSMLGFKLSGQKPDPGHPFGHGRIEYVSGFIVSIFIIVMGFELGKSSVSKIINPDKVSFGAVSICILFASICVKLYMTFYNRNVGKKIGSAAMRAVAADSLSDSIATATVLICAVISYFTNINIDGWCGAAVAVFITVSGCRAAKDTIDPLLGQPADAEVVERIKKIVMSHDEVIGIHDLVVHNYGPGRMMITLHAEVSDKSDFCHIHDTIDNIENDLSEELGCNAVIHMDPIAADDEETVRVKGQMAELVKAMDGNITIHDFRMVRGITHTNLIFDIVVPFGFRLSDDEIMEEVSRIAKVLDPSYCTVIKVDKPYENKR